MKKNILIKIIPILVMLLVVLSNFSSAEAADGGLLQKMRSQIDSFSPSPGVTINTQNIVSPFVELTQILMTIGAGVLVAVTTYMGIKYLTSGPEAQAKLKIQLIGIVVAGFVIFGAYFIWRVVVTFANNSFS